MADKRPERRQANITNINWQKALESVGLNKFDRSIQTNKNYLAHLNMTADQIKDIRGGRDTKDLLDTEELLREMRLEETQMDNLDYDSDKYENFKHLENTRQDKDSWY